MGLAFSRAGKEPAARQALAEQYLKAGEISGEEYLDFVSDYELCLYGVEDSALYDANLALFVQIDSLRPRALSSLQAFLSSIEQLKPLVYNQALQKFDSQVCSFRDRKLALLGYCVYLAQAAKDNALSLDGYPNLMAFLETARLEEDTDFNQAQLERNSLIKWLITQLDEKTGQELLRRSQDFKEEKMSAVTYYSFLQESASAAGVDLAKQYPRLSMYIRYLSLGGGINTQTLLKEAESLKDALCQALAVTPQEQELVGIADGAWRLKKLIDLELTPDEYALWQAQRSRHSLAAWQAFLKEECTRRNLEYVAIDTAVVDDNLQLWEEFYSMGAFREEAFIENMTAKLEEGEENMAVLIAGGFHAPGITRMLRQRGYSYLVVVPALAEASDAQLYFSVLKKKSSHLQAP